MLEFPPICSQYDDVENAPMPFLNLGEYALTAELWTFIWKQYRECRQKHNTELVVAPYLVGTPSIRRLGLAIQKIFISAAKSGGPVNVLLHIGLDMSIVPQLVFPSSCIPIRPDTSKPASIANYLSYPEHFVSKDYLPFAVEQGKINNGAAILTYFSQEFAKEFPVIYAKQQWKFDPTLSLVSPAAQTTFYQALYDSYATVARQAAENVQDMATAVADNKTLLGYAARCARLMTNTVQSIMSDVARYSQDGSAGAVIECYEDYLETPLAVSYRSYHSALALLRYLLRRPSDSEEDPTRAIEFLVSAAMQSYAEFTKCKDGRP